MTSGTKIVLATAALFVGILVTYYGFLMPGGDEPTPSPDQLAASDRPSDVMEGMDDGDDDLDLEAGPSQSFGMPEETLSGPMAYPERPEVVSRSAMPPVASPVASPVARSATGTGPGVTPRTPAADRADVTPVRMPAAAAAGVHETRPDRVVHRAGPGAPAAVQDRGSRDASPTRRRPAASVARPEDRTPAPTMRTTPRERVSPPSAGPARLYVVAEGDTLSMIALDELDDASRWPEIAALNGIDPDRLRVGQTLRLPTRTLKTGPPRSPRSPRATVRVHEVTAGDTLIRLARRYYREPGAWTVIYEANRRKLGGDPHDLVVGMRLTIPAR